MLTKSLLHFVVQNYSTALCGNCQYNKMRCDNVSIEVREMYQRIRDLREDKDLKQKDLAAYLNCSQQVYSNYELGQRDIPTDILIRLSKFYDVSVDYLLGLTSNPKRNK